MIYLITNKINGKRYVGKAKNLKARWYQHCWSSKNSSQTYIHRAIRKYGKRNFKIDFVCEGYDKEEVEQVALLLPEYNMTIGGDGGDTSKSPNYKTAIQLRDMSGKNNPMWGKFGKDNPNFGQIRGKTPKISEGKSKQKWKIITPEGKTLIVCNLEKFCNDLGFSDSTHMYAVAKGKRNHHMGYKVKKWR